MSKISIEVLRERFAYDPKTGVVTYATRCGNCLKGMRAGSVKSESGYRIIKIGKKELREHRVIFVLMKGQWPTDCMDHINGDRTDNRWENLREATQTQNRWNGKGFSSRKARAKGVHFHQKSGKWQAKIGFGGVMHQLGFFETHDEAAAARKKAACEMYGEFAYELRSER